jgi:HEAT repeat protein
VITRDAVVRHQIMVDRQHQTFDLALPAAPISFRFDEGGWLLGTVTTDQTPAELAELAKHDLDFTARYWALRQLASLSDSAAVSARRLIALNEHNEHLRAEAVRQLGGDGSAESRSVVRSALQDPSGEVRSAALRGVVRADSVGGQVIVVDMIEHDPSALVQVVGLGLYNPNVATQGTALLVDRLQHGATHAIRNTAAQSLLKKPDAAGAAALEAATQPVETRDLRTIALQVLARWPDKSTAIAVATRYLHDGDPLFAVAAAQQLGAIGGDAGRAALQAALQSEQRVTVRAAINEALSKK